MHKLIVPIDPAYDCACARWSCEEADDLAAAWRGALSWLGEQLGLDVDSTTDDSCATRTTLSCGEYAESLLWQAAHDCVSRTGSKPGDLWQWRERPDITVSLRRSLTELLPTSATTHTNQERRALALFDE